MDWFNNFLASAKKTMSQYNNATFKDAAMATCALIAAADGSVDKEERKKVANLIAKNELLQSFNASELGDLFTGFCDKAGDDFARIDLLNLVRKLKGDETASDTCLRVALVIANADGNFDDKEKAVVRELCSVLGLKSADYIPA